MVKRCATGFLVMFLASLCCDNVILASKDKEESNPTPKFVPTSEWQRVQKGQPLPAGLHYRININSGETEAKLLETDSDKKSKTGLVALPPEKSDDSGDAPYMSKDELKKVLADITGDDPQESEKSQDAEDKNKVGDKFRSYEDLKKEFDTLNMTVETDMEILSKLVKNVREFSSTTSDDEIVSVLRDLEYLVHQIDNAVEFIRLGGLSHIIIPALNSTSAEVRAESLRLLGSAVQSNPKAQVAALNSGLMPNLVKAVALDSDVMVRSHAVFALSCLTRQFPAAQAKLIAEGGLTSLSAILDSKHSSDFKTKIRVITLINDLLLERVLVREAAKKIENVDYSKESDAVQKVHQHNQGELREKLRQYDAINLEKRFVEDGWCHKLSDFLWMLYESEANSGRAKRRDDLGSIISKDVPYRPEHDSVEKVMDTFHVMKDICQDEFRSNKKLEEVLSQFLLWYQELSMREEVLQKQSLKEKCSGGSEHCQNEGDSESVENTDMYYSTIAEKFKELVKFIKRNHDVKDEL